MNSTLLPEALSSNDISAVDGELPSHRFIQKHLAVYSLIRSYQVILSYFQHTGCAKKHVPCQTLTDIYLGCGAVFKLLLPYRNLTSHQFCSKISDQNVVMIIFNLSSVLYSKEISLMYGGGHILGTFRITVKIRVHCIMSLD